MVVFQGEETRHLCGKVCLEWGQKWVMMAKELCIPSNEG